MATTLVPAAATGAVQLHTGVTQLWLSAQLGAMSCWQVPEGGA